MGETKETKSCNVIYCKVNIFLTSKRAGENVTGLKETTWSHLDKTYQKPTDDCRLDLVAHLLNVWPKHKIGV